jgi:hypothetical protein
MNKSRFVAYILIALLTTSVAAFGASKKKSSPPPAAAKSPTISSVTATSVTISEANGSKTLQINQFTEITVNGQKATVADLKPGMTVNVTLGTDASKASRIAASTK